MLRDSNKRQSLEALENRIYGTITEGGRTLDDSDIFLTQKAGKTWLADGEDNSNVKKA